MPRENALRIEDYPEKWVEDRIRNFIAGSEVNRLALDGQVIFDEPLVGFARGDDPLFRRCKRVIWKFQYTPLEWMRFGLGGESPRNLWAKDLRVIAWVLPITDGTRQENRMEVKVTSRRWAHTRLYGEECNQALRS